MKATTRAVILAVVAVAAVTAVVLRSHNLKAPENSGGEPAAATQAALPRLVDLGATKCIPCKATAPILEPLLGGEIGLVAVVGDADAAHQFHHEVRAGPRSVVPASSTLAMFG